VTPRKREQLQVAVRSKIPSRNHNSAAGRILLTSAKPPLRRFARRLTTARGSRIHSALTACPFKTTYRASPLITARLSLPRCLRSRGRSRLRCPGHKCHLLPPPPVDHHSMRPEETRSISWPKISSDKGCPLRGCRCLCGEQRQPSSTTSWSLSPFPSRIWSKI